MGLNLREISPATIERFLDTALPLLTGLKYKSKLQKFENKSSSYPYKISIEVTESPRQTSDYETLKSFFESFINEENFQKKYRCLKNSES